VEKRKRLRSEGALREARSEPCVVCGCKSDAAHVRSRGSGGGDEPANLMPLCRRHHSEQHSGGWHRFANAHMSVMEALWRRGWRFELTPPVWKLVKASGGEEE